MTLDLTFAPFRRTFIAKMCPHRGRKLFSFPPWNLPTVQTHPFYAHQPENIFFSRSLGLYYRVFLLPLLAHCCNSIHVEGLRSVAMASHHKVTPVEL